MDKTVTLHLNPEHDIDPTMITGVLDQPRTQAWTSVSFESGKSLEWLFLWLACTQAGMLCRMVSQPAAVAAGVVDPMFPGSALTVVNRTNLAYLTWRAADGARDRRKRGRPVIGHGTAAATLTGRVTEAIQNHSIG